MYGKALFFQSLSCPHSGCATTFRQTLGAHHQCPSDPVQHPPLPQALCLSLWVWAQHLAQRSELSSEQRQHPRAALEDGSEGKEEMAIPVLD